MNKKDFLRQLADDIKVLPVTEKDGLITYYTEILEDRIEDGMSEEEAVSSLGNAKDIVDQILAEHGTQKITEAKVKKGGRRTLILALTSPIWSFLFLSYFMLLISGYILVGALSLILGVLVFAFGVGAAASLFSLPFVFPDGMLHGMLNLGTAFACAGLLVFSVGWFQCGTKRLLRWGYWMSAQTVKLWKAFFGISAKEQQADQEKQQHIWEKKSKPERFRKAFAASAAGLIAAGMAVILIQFASIGFDTDKLNTDPPLVSSSYECGIEDINEIAVSTEYFDLMAVAVPSDKFRITYQENEKQGYEINETGGILSIKHVSRRKWTEYLHTFNVIPHLGRNTVLIEIPEQYAGSLKVKSLSGITVQDLKLLQKLSVRGHYDAISMDNLSVSEDITASGKGELNLTNTMAQGEITAVTSYHDMNLENITANGSVNLRNPNGGIAMNGLTVQGKLFCSNSYAAIEGKDLKAGSIQIKGSNKTIKLESLSAVEDLSVRTEYGTVILMDAAAGGSIKVTADSSTLEFDRVTGNNVIGKTSYDNIKINALSGNNVDLRAASGSIRGVMAGSWNDYQISYDVDSGSCNLPRKTSGPKVLYTKASYGNIDITFEEDY